MLNFLQAYSGIELIIVLVAYILAVLLAIVLHEVSHGLVAQKCGDDTARLSGRLTLNPLKHLDALGTLCLLIVGFGWAKPVPVNINNFKERKKGLFLVSIAGIVTNLVLAFFSVAFYIGLLFLSVRIFSITATNIFVIYLVNFLCNFFEFSAVINLSLMLFNLFPVYPLDGFNLVTALSSYSNNFVIHMQRYSLIYSVLLIVLANKFLAPAVEWVLNKFIFFWIMAL